MLGNGFEDTITDTLPKSWQLVQLGDLASAIANSFVDGPFGSNLKVSDFIESSEIRVIQLQNIGIGRFYDINHKYIDERKFEELIRHETLPGDIVIAKMADPVGRACIAPPLSSKFVIVADCMRLRPNPELVDRYFLMWAINSQRVRRQAESFATGTTRQRISLSNTKKLSIPLPPLPEQQAIAHVLNTVRQSIETTERVIAAARELKRSLMRHLFTYGSVPIEKADNTLLKDTEIGEMPYRWVDANLGDVITLRRGFDLPKDRREPGLVPVISSSGLTGYHKEAKLKGPGVVIGRYGSIGNVQYVNDDYWPLNTTLYVEDFKKNDPEFVSLLLTRINYETYNDKTSVPGVNRNHLHQIRLAVPGLEEQLQIARSINVVNEKIQSEASKKSALKALFNSLLHNLMIGKVRIQV